jgi:hypothetical protein
VFCILASLPSACACACTVCSAMAQKKKEEEKEGCSAAAAAAPSTLHVFAWASCAAYACTTHRPAMCWLRTGLFFLCKGSLVLDIIFSQHAAAAAALCAVAVYSFNPPPPLRSFLPPPSICLLHVAMRRPVLTQHIAFSKFRFFATVSPPFISHSPSLRGHAMLHTSTIFPNETQPYPANGSLSMTTTCAFAAAAVFCFGRV